MLNHQPPTESAYLQFGQNHQPALDAGDYTLTVEQTLTDGANNTATYSRKLSFSVLGERFSLPAPLVHSVFPPANGLGEYNNVLPHIVLQRSTLPWERDAQPDNETAPWLALLVFSPDELTVMPAATNVTDSPTARLEAQIGYSLEVNDLLAGGMTKKPQFAAAQTAWTGLELETGQTKTDRVSVIFVPKKTVLPLLPTLDDLTKLAHVRRGTNERSELVEDERPVILSKRLPQKGGESIVHLVSLENRYGADGRFQFNGAGDDDPIPFISLYTWRFTSLSPKHTFRGLLLHLNQVPIFHVPDSTDLDLDFARQSGIPAKLRMEFAQAGYPLSEGSATTMTDRADREIVLKDYHWLIGNSGAVYDQAGYVQFQLDGLPTTADKAKPEAIIAAIRSRVSNLPSTATVTPLQVRHWWVTDQITNRRYFVRHSAGAVEALQLELDHAPVLRLPDTGHELANRFLHQGYVPLPHYPRQGGKTVSWYRGPLTTSEKKAATLNRNLFDVNTPDELLLYHTDVGTFDLTYAAAWELGRLLALQSKRFSVGLHQWRRTHARATGQAELHEAHLHLPLSGTADAALTAEFPPVLQAWLAQLWTLEGIPYNYLA
ncbi:MAG: hypothetical protein H7319_01705 [Spirosoma sp.]|nr:hypothetical protein [Spirosoma sp.]